MQAEIAVFAVGNRSRGDDAVAPMLLERLAGWLQRKGREQAFDLIEDYQLQIEHALDLQGKQLALFIDAGYRTRAPLDFYAVDAAQEAAARATHALEPQGVLGVYRQVVRAEPPSSFVLCVRGERFELGDGLSEQARAHAHEAWLALMCLCRQPEAARWRAFAENVAEMGGKAHRTAAAGFRGGARRALEP